MAAQGYPQGCVVAAEEQTAGRGRFPERRWESERGKNLLFTIILDPASAALPGLPIRVGLALSQAVDRYAERLNLRFRTESRIKWPNDLMFGERKIAGILCEASSGGVFAGVGLNCNQSAFPPGLEKRTTSLARESGQEIDRWAILELFLERLSKALSDPAWRRTIDARLWRRGEEVEFLPGAEARSTASAGRIQRDGRVRGILTGIDESGSILIRPRGEEEARAFAAGEIIRRQTS
jgi:BirA family biotin operon repressor/biotin-[acetyl-CoA-carboxylase] ligase